MKMKFILGLFSMLLVSMTLAFHTASAKDVLINEMDKTNPFDRGKISNNVWIDDYSSTGTQSAWWRKAWAYDNTKDYDISTNYVLYPSGDAKNAAQLDLGLLKIAFNPKNDWLQTGVAIKDGSTWQKFSVDDNKKAITTSDNAEWRLVYKADKNFILYKNGSAIITGKVNALPNSQTFDIESMIYYLTANIGYIRITDNTATAPAAPATLTATTQNNTPVLTWSASDKATSYTVSRSVYANGPFTDIAQNIKDVNYTDASAKAGNTYYYVVKASNESGTSPASNTASVTLEAPRSSLDVIIKPESTTVGETFTADIALKNVQDIYAEDFSLSYDPTLVEYVGYEAVTGYKVYNETKDTPGALRFIIASQGKSYVINSDTTIVKLKFKAIAAGSAKIDALKARVADTTKEYDLETANVLEDTILIEKPRFLDVDRSGQYTLLDLSLDAFYFGLSADDTNKDLYDADQTEDNKVGDDDLTYIVDQILKNKEYTPNQ